MRNIHSLLVDSYTDTYPKGVTTIEQGLAYQPINLDISLNGQEKSFSAYRYAPRVLHFKQATLIGGRYPSIGQHLWINGATYFADKMETPQTVGGVTFNQIQLLAATRQHTTIFASKVILIGGRGNFGHFIFEILPRIVYLRKYLAFGYKFLVLDNFPGRFLDFCLAFGIEKESFLIVEDWANVECTELLVSGCLVHRNPIDRRPALSLDVMYEIRDSVRKWSINSARPPTASLTLFTSRAEERWRRVVNEEAVIRHLSNVGVPLQIFRPDQLPAQSQVDLIDSAQVHVSPIGGASPSSLFMRPNTTLVELTTPAIDGVFAHRLWCALAGVKLERIIGKFNAECLNHGTIEADRDFEVPPSEVTSAVLRALQCA